MSPKFKECHGYVFKACSNEEPRKYIHVTKADKEAWHWLEPRIEPAGNHGFSGKEQKLIIYNNLRQVERDMENTEKTTTGLEALLKVYKALVYLTWPFLLATSLMTILLFFLFI